MAARNCTLTFGLLTVAAKLEVATDKAPDMSNLCVGQPGKDAHDALPVKAPKTCTECGEITDLAALVKGVKQGQAYTLIDPDAITEAKASYSAGYKGKIDLVPHPAAEFLAHTEQGDSLHYLTPADAGGENHYQLMVRLVESHPELAFASLYTPVSATSLYMLRVREGVLMLEKRTRGQAMRPVPSVGGQVNDALYAMLDGSLEQFVVPYDPEAYEDAYGQALAKLLAEGEQVSVAGGAVATPVPVQTDDDLMAKLAALNSKVA